MKHSLTRATVVVGQLAVAAVMIQGCRTYTPGNRTALGGGTTELKQGTVVTLPSEAAGTTTITTVPVSRQTIPVGRVGAPGTYKEFVVDPGAGMKDPHAGLIKSATKHVPAPPPSPITVERTSKKLSADGKYAIYVVKRGDSAGVIANKHGMTKAEFLRLNSISSPDRIRVGQEFKIPADGKPLSGGKASGGSSVSDGNTYAVASGDTLSEIAAKFGMKTSDLMAMNGLQSANMVRVGQKLRVSKSSTGAVDTAKKNATEIVTPTDKTTTPSVEPIVAPNTGEGLEALIDMTTSGTEPKSLIEAKKVAVDPTINAVAEVAKPVTGAVVPAKEHTVQEGEDVFGLAVKYNVRPMDIRRENNMTGSALVPGTVIKIPATQGN